MRKSDLIKEVSNKVQQPESQVGAVVNATFDAIRESLSDGQDVSIAGFGTFRRATETPFNMILEARR